MRLACSTPLMLGGVLTCLSESLVVKVEIVTASRSSARCLFKLTKSFNQPEHACRIYEGVRRGCGLERIEGWQHCTESDIRYFRRTYACAHDTFPFPALAPVARSLPENFLCALTGCVQESKITRCPLRELEETGGGDHTLNLSCATNAGLGQPTKCEGPTSALA